MPGRTLQDAFSMTLRDKQSNRSKVFLEVGLKSGRGATFIQPEAGRFLSRCQHRNVSHDRGRVRPACKPQAVVR